MMACVRLPHFATALEARAHPDLRSQPLVLVDEGQRVTDVSPQAAWAGVRAGMSLTQAGAQCANLLVRPAVRSRTQQALADLLAALTTFTERVEAEDGLELRADARRWRHTTFLHPAQLDSTPAATCYLDLGKLGLGALDLVLYVAVELLRLQRQRDRKLLDWGCHSTSSTPSPRRIAC